MRGSNTGEVRFPPSASSSLALTRVPSAARLRRLLCPRLKRPRQAEQGRRRPHVRPRPRAHRPVRRTARLDAGCVRRESGVGASSAVSPERALTSHRCSLPQYALPYVHERKQFGVPIGTFQLMQGKIADMYTKVSASRAYLYSVARGTSFSFSPFASLRSSFNCFRAACDAGQITNRVRCEKAKLVGRTHHSSLVSRRTAPAQSSTRPTAQRRSASRRCRCSGASSTAHVDDGSALTVPACAAATATRTTTRSTASFAMRCCTRSELVGRLAHELFVVTVADSRSSRRHSGDPKDAHRKGVQ